MNNIFRVGTCSGDCGGGHPGGVRQLPWRRPAGFDPGPGFDNPSNEFGGVAWLIEIGGRPGGTRTPNQSVMSALL